MRLRVEGCLHSEREPAPSGEIGSCAGHAYFAPAKQKEPAGLGCGFRCLGFWALFFSFPGSGVGVEGLGIGIWKMHCFETVYAYFRLLIH